MNIKEELSTWGLESSKKFVPVAYYDKFMDTIRIEFRDCSSWEKRVDECLTLIFDNFPENEGSQELCGLVIKGVGHLFGSLGLPDHGVIKVAELLDRVIKETYSDALSKKEVTRAFQVVETLDMQLDYNLKAA